MLDRPRYISETRPSGSDSPKCFTLGLGRMAKFSHGTHSIIIDSNLNPNPARSRSGPMKFLGTCQGLLHPVFTSARREYRAKVASQRANAHCLRPQAEFARASGRGLRQVKNFIKDAKGMCKKQCFILLRMQTEQRRPTSDPEDPLFLSQ
jgi:hypothetical protein